MQCLSCAGRDQLGLALTSGSRLGAASVGTGAIDGAVLDDDELQPPTRNAAPRIRIAIRDLNGQVLLGSLGASTTLRTRPARPGYGARS